MKIKSTILSIFLAGGIAYAGEHEGEAKTVNPEQGNVQQQQDVKKDTLKKAREMRQVQGTILKHKTVRIAPKGQETKKEKHSESLVVLIKPNKGNDRLVVDLGQPANLPEITDGKTKIQAKGRLVKLDKKEFFVAKEAKFDGNAVTLNRTSPKQAQEAPKKQAQEESLKQEQTETPESDQKTESHSEQM
ncbi:MAG: hypothetical protein CME64_16380 [Halobacteriovoraceae bacterium]|nr:hypothetical protein [Halobacteriovoraceae bacterium]|tara:strand:- start:95765 stop:96331 length:567 start_codon:yes stop_codon:yes gene_type:complete